MTLRERFKRAQARYVISRRLGLNVVTALAVAIF